MKEKLKQFCRSQGLEYVGIAPPGPYPELAAILHDRMAKGQCTEFDGPDIAKRIDPRLTMPDVQSVIVCLFPYYIGHQAPANLAKYTYGLDYHHIIRRKLDEIGIYLQANIPGFAYQPFVDTGPLVDRYLAYLAGLGFYGINSHIITDKYGSYVFIGYLLTNYPFAPDRPQNRTCIQCGQCVKMCPGQIILGNFAIDPRGCRSYLTQKKGDLSPAEISIIQKTGLVFGCDVCQDVCPHNRDVALTPLAEFRQQLLPWLDETEVAALSNKEFTCRYGDRAFSWRGKKILLRNFAYIQGRQCR